MKLFVSFAYTGEDPDVVEARMARVVDVIQAAGYEAYCILFDPKAANYTQYGDFLIHALAAMVGCDGVIAIVASERRSEGQLMELGAALAREKPILLLQHTSAEGKSYIGEVATRTISWDTDDELADNITEAICDGFILKS